MEKDRPLYRVIYDDILRKIQRGDYPNGTRIPTEAEWARMYNVSRITSKRALDMAAENGIITRYPRRGSFVAIDATKARSYRTGQKNRVVGIILPSLSDTFGLELFQTLESAFQECGIITVTGISKDHYSLESKLIASHVDFGVDGLIIKPVHDETFNQDILKLIVDGFPVVLIDRYLKDVSCPNVTSNNFQGAVDGMQHLYELGHRNIGIISRRIGDTTTLQERYNGVLHSIMQAGIQFNPQWFLTDLAESDCDYSESWTDARDRVCRFLESNPELTAVFGLKYSVVPVLEEAAHKVGRRIPEDLSVICFDSSDRLLNSIHQVTHIRQNEQEIARHAFEAISTRLNKGERDDSSMEYVVDTELVPGRTTAPIRQDLAQA
ncbi:GntR family transcriptional regulator [Alkalispirochaeta alkalica]|uniref:GntR family transcriptional regulator n=1 Tax=Alkalispirochaeta alkalica TaxID=46356 RepID=UPI0003723D5D|nr:GntR family transcriptional regulator [Alkalispirochaeta alkalica]